MIWNKSRCALAVLLTTMTALQGCTDKAATAPKAVAAAATQQTFSPITIVHKLGTTVLKHRP